MEKECDEKDIMLQPECYCQGGGGGSEYFAGDGIEINDENVISVDKETIQEKLTAGNFITIFNNLISSSISRQLTSDDYNDDPENPRCVTLRNLDSGFYWRYSDVLLYADKYGGIEEDSLAFWIFKAAPNRKYVFIMDPGEPEGDLKLYELTLQPGNNATYMLLGTIAEYETIIGLLANLVVKGSGVPTEDTSPASNVGTIYENEDSLYFLSAKDSEGKNTWTKIWPVDNFTGTDGITAGVAGLVPAPATTDVDKYLKSDGTWGAVASGPTVVQTTGTSTTDVMSQKAVTDELYPQYSSYARGVIAIGNHGTIADYGAYKVGIGAVNLGSNSAYALAINGGDTGGTVNAISGMGIWAGNGGSVTGRSGIAIGNGASVSGNGAVAIGRGSSATLQGQFDIGTTETGYGYNSTNYRLLTGLYDPVNAHDGANKEYVDNLVINYATLSGAGAPTTSTVAYKVGQFYYDTTNDSYYYCSDIDNTDPQNIVYTWTALVTGGGEVIKTLTSADYNYPDANPQYVALWLLEPGMYTIEGSDIDWQKILPYSANYTGIPNWSTYSTYFILPFTNNGFETFYAFSKTGIRPQITYWTINRAYPWNYYYAGEMLLTSNDIVDNLNSASATKALSANQGRVLKELIDSRVISGAGAPTTATAGTVGQLYEDTTNGDLYICTDATNPYVWEAVGAGGGPTVVQTTGTSTTDVMSQDATTSMVFSDPGTNSKVKIGSSTSNTGQSTTTIGYQAKTGGNQSTALGYSAYARTIASVAIGDSAEAGSALTHYRAVAIGQQAHAYNLGAIALGANSSATEVGEMNIGTTNSSWGYNSTNYRLLTGVHDPVNAHDAATKNYVDNLVINYATLTAAGAPTTSTAAVSVGQLYYDSTNDDYYYCSAIDTTDPDNILYTWTAFSTGGSITPVQTTGTSTTDVMSQNAVTNVIYSDPANRTKIRIGDGGVNGVECVSIGKSTYTRGDYSIAIGPRAGSQVTNAPGGVSLGAFAKAGGQGQVSIGLESATPQVKAACGYNGSEYRLITGVYDGQSAHDVATVGQINATIDAINTALSTNIPHIGA